MIRWLNVIYLAVLRDAAPRVTAGSRLSQTAAEIPATVV